MFASCCKMFNFFHCKGRPHKYFCSQSSPPPHKHCRCFLLCCYSSSRALKTQCCLCTSIMNAAATCIDVQLFNVYIYLMHIQCRSVPWELGLNNEFSIYKTKVIFLQVCFDLNHQRNGCCSFFSFLKIKYVLKFFYMRTRRRKLCTDGRELYYLYRWNVLRIKRRNLLYCFSFVCCKTKEEFMVYGLL